MIETTLFGIGLILVIFTWHFMWRPTVLDTTRDKLFDLRDEQIRNYFVQRRLPLDHKLYRELRDLINGHLRHTESLSFFRFIFMIVWVEHHQDVNTTILERIERRFRTDDAELAAFIRQVREQAVTIMIEYMVESSIAAFLLSMIGMVVLTISAVWKAISQLFRGVDSVTFFALARFAVALLAVTSSLGLANRNDAQATMEEYALVTGA